MPKRTKKNNSRPRKKTIAEPKADKKIVHLGGKSHYSAKKSRFLNKFC